MNDPVRQEGAARREQLFLVAVLALSSAAGVAMVAFRLFYSGTAGYAMMPWNLFLAAVPLGLALAMGWVHERGRGGVALLGALGCLWLLFFPNAPYLLTEFMHLDPGYAVSERPLRRLAGVSPRGDVPVWYDAVLIMVFAWNGLLMGFVSLSVVQRVVWQRLGGRAAWAMAMVVLALAGFGVSIGRFQRWNSWDLFTQPGALLTDVLSRMFNPLDHLRTTAVTVLVSSFLVMAYLSLIALGALTPGRERRVVGGEGPC